MIGGGVRETERKMPIVIVLVGNLSLRGGREIRDLV